MVPWSLDLDPPIFHLQSVIGLQPQYKMTIWNRRAFLELALSGLSKSDNEDSLLKGVERRGAIRGGGGGGSSRAKRALVVASWVPSAFWEANCPPDKWRYRPTILCEGDSTCYVGPTISKRQHSQFEIVGFSCVTVVKSSGPRHKVPNVTQVNLAVVNQSIGVPWRDLGLVTSVASGARDFCFASVMLTGFSSHSVCRPDRWTHVSHRVIHLVSLRDRKDILCLRWELPNIRHFRQPPKDIINKPFRWIKICPSGWFGVRWRPWTLFGRWQGCDRKAHSPFGESRLLHSHFRGVQSNNETNGNVFNHF